MYGQTLAPGATPSIFGFTGEPTDANGLVQLRARYYNPTLGMFPSLDPLEGDMEQPMSLNRYMYVQGTVVDAIDPSGLDYRSPRPEWWDTCSLGLDKRCGCWMMPPYYDNLAFLECLQGKRSPCPSSCADCQNRCRQNERFCREFDWYCAYLCKVATPVPTKTPTPTPMPCPTDSLFGCYPGTSAPINAAWIPNTHVSGNFGPVAADFVPEDAPSGTNPNWEAVAPFSDPARRTVHAVVGGKVYDLGKGHYRIRTGGTVQRGGKQFGICYEYLHLQPNPTIPGPANGATIPAGTTLGMIEPWQVDQNLQYDRNNGPSHVHVAIYPCSANDPLMNLAAGENSQIDPLTVLKHVRR